MNYKIILGIAASVISFIGYIPYLRDIFLKKTKPHVFTWLVWSLIGGIVFFAQLSKGGGSGSWVTGVGSIICFSIAVLAVFQGEKMITASDWLAFTGALIGLILWRITNNPLFAIIIVTITDALAFVPTFRKAYYKPYEETLITWFFSSFKFIIAIIAMQSYNVTTTLYPASLVLTNGIFGAMLIMRRRVYKMKKVFAKDIK